MNDLCTALGTIWLNWTWRQRWEFFWIVLQLLPFLPLILFVLACHTSAKDCPNEARQV